MGRPLLHTDRITGSNPSARDAAYLLALFNGSSHTDIGATAFYTYHDVIESLDAQKLAKRERERAHFWVMLRNEAREKIGLGTIVPSTLIEGAADIGVVLGRPFHGRGYGREVMCGLAKLAFKSVAYRRSTIATAVTNPANTGSVRMLVAAGFHAGPIAPLAAWNGLEHEDEQSFRLPRKALGL